ncbi:hypothetical protein B7463_g416, partial [Scytalidium lignicola]
MSTTPANQIDSVADFRSEVTIPCGYAFPTVYFLDNEMFKRSLTEIPRMDFQVSAGIRNLVGSTEDRQGAALLYFRMVHPWMPFISKKLFYDQLLSPLAPLRAENILLFACMKLAVSSPRDNSPRNSQYLTVKLELFKAEIAGVLTFRALQAWVLMSLYEVGHGIYPAAYISISTSARYASALGVTASRESLSGFPSGWISAEERKRTWWAVRILDCYANLGIRDRPLATKDPKQDDTLPMDDVAWDHGGPEPRSAFTLSTPPSPAMGRFNLLAQAANLLGQVLRHICEHDADREFHAQEAEILERTLIALTNVSREESRTRGMGICGPTTVCHSARVALNFRATASGTESWAIDDIRVAPVAKYEVAEEILKLSRWALSTVQPNTGELSNADEVSPFLLDCMYRTATLYAQLYCEVGDQAYAEASKDAKKALSWLNRRWAAAGEYITLLDAWDASHIY